MFGAKEQVFAQWAKRPRTARHGCADRERLNRKFSAPCNRVERTMEGTAMMAEIFMLRLEAAARAAKEAATTNSRFVPNTLAAASLGRLAHAQPHPLAK